MIKQERALQTRSKVLFGAAEVFYKRGYSSANVSEILRAAEVTKGAMYFHFQSKEELAQALIEEQRDWMTVDEYSQQPVQDLVDMTHAFARALQTDIVASAAIRLVLETGTFTGQGAVPYQDWSATVQKMLLRASQLGEIRTEVDLSEMATIIIGSFTGIHATSRATDEVHMLSSRITDMWRLLLPAVVPLNRYQNLVLSGTKRAGGSLEEAGTDPDGAVF